MAYINSDMKKALDHSTSIFQSYCTIPVSYTDNVIMNPRRTHLDSETCGPRSVFLIPTQINISALPRCAQDISDIDVA